MKFSTTTVKHSVASGGSWGEGLVLEQSEATQGPWGWSLGPKGWALHMGTSEPFCSVPVVRPWSLGFQKLTASPGPAEQGRGPEGGDQETRMRSLSSRSSSTPCTSTSHDYTS